MTRRREERKWRGERKVREGGREKIRDRKKRKKPQGKKAMFKEER